MPPWPQLQALLVMTIETEEYVDWGPHLPCDEGKLLSMRHHFPVLLS